MDLYAALDVLQEQTAICVVDAGGTILAEGKVPTCPDAIAAWLAQWPGATRRVGMETGPLAVWLWNALRAKGLPIVCLDARHAHGVLRMMPNKTDRHDAQGLAQIVRTGWYKEVRIKSHGAYVAHALLSARAALVGIRVRLENEMRGLLKTFGVMSGQARRRLRAARRGDHSGGALDHPRTPADLRGAGRRSSGDPRAGPGARCPAPRRRKAEPRRPPAHDRARRRPRHRPRRRRCLRRRRTLPPLIKRRRLSRPDAEASRVRRGQLQRPRLEARRQDDQDLPLRGRQRGADPQDRRVAPARLGARDRCTRPGPRKARVALARKLAVTLHAMWRTGMPFKDRAAA